MSRKIIFSVITSILILGGFGLIQDVHAAEIPVSDNDVFVDLTIASGDTLTLDAIGVTLTGTTTIESGGTLLMINDASLDNDSTINSDGLINIIDSDLQNWDGTVNNSGQINLSQTVGNPGFSGGTLNNFGTLNHDDGTMNNFDVFTNHGTFITGSPGSGFFNTNMENFGIFQIESGASTEITETFTNHNNAQVIILNDGQFAVTGIANNDGEIIVDGHLDVRELTIFNNNPGGFIHGSGTMTIDGQVNNSDIIRLIDDGDFTSNLGISNNGELNNNGTIEAVNEFTTEGTINNNGQIIVGAFTADNTNVRLSNGFGGVINNNGQITNFGFTENSSIINVIGSFTSFDGDILNEGEQAVITISGNGTFDNNGGTFDNLNGASIILDGGNATLFNNPSEGVGGNGVINNFGDGDGFFSSVIDVSGGTIANNGEINNCFGTIISEENISGNPVNDCNTPPEDSDNDGVPDEQDNCPTVPNPDQTDSNGNGIGDACEAPVEDSDNDGVPDEQDNCPTVPNPDQTDSNGNGIGDACEAPEPEGKNNPCDALEKAETKGKGKHKGISKAKANNNCE